jgi:hypothetical protein
MIASIRAAGTISIGIKTVSCNGGLTHVGPLGPTSPRPNEGQHRRDRELPADQSALAFPGNLKACS